MITNLILMAAGFGRRFGGNKLLHLIDGKPMYQYILDTLCDLVKESPEDYNLIVVTQYEEIAEKLRDKPLTCVMNYESELGISSSLKLGLKAAKALSEREAGYMFLVADQPYLKSQTIKRLILDHEKHPSEISCLSHGSDFGNPVIFAEKYVPELLALEGDVGGKKVMRQHLKEVHCFEVEDKKELEDIDW